MGHSIQRDQLVTHALPDAACLSNHHSSCLCPRAHTWYARASHISASPPVTLLRPALSTACSKNDTLSLYWPRSYAWCEDARDALERVGLWVGHGVQAHTSQRSVHNVRHTSCGTTHTCRRCCCSAAGALAAAIIAAGKERLSRTFLPASR